MANASGDSIGEVLRLDFDRRLSLLLAFRELDDALSFGLKGRAESE
jgi:hypothetical protein